MRSSNPAVNKHEHEHEHEPAFAETVPAETLAGSSDSLESVAEGALGERPLPAAWFERLGDPNDCLGEAVLARASEDPSPEQAERAAGLRRELFALSVGADPRPLDERRLVAAELANTIGTKLS